MLIKQDKQEMALMETFLRHMCSGGWDLNPTKMWSPNISVESVGIQWTGVCQNCFTK